MARKRFTPGPWVVEDRDTGKGEDAQRFVCADHAPIGERLPAVAHGPNRLANARLIAKAPAMYEVLRALVAILDAQVPSGLTDDERNVREAARDILAEAEGR